MPTDARRDNEAAISARDGSELASICVCQLILLDALLKNGH